MNPPHTGQAGWGKLQSGYCRCCCPNKAMPDSIVVDPCTPDDYVRAYTLPNDRHPCKRQAPEIPRGEMEIKMGQNGPQFRPGSGAGSRRAATERWAKANPPNSTNVKTASPASAFRKNGMALM